MVERGYGRIVNIGAESVRNGLVDHAMYNAAKGGAARHGHRAGQGVRLGRITVNTVAPSYVQTPEITAALAANRFDQEFLRVPDRPPSSSDGPARLARDALTHRRHAHRSTRTSFRQLTLITWPVTIAGVRAGPVRHRPHPVHRPAARDELGGPIRHAQNSWSNGSRRARR